MFSLYLMMMRHLPQYVHPFLSLQYPTDTPTDPDSFPMSSYYNTGKLDICIIITCIIVMAILRDAFRLWLFEPFARWKLSRDLELRKKKAVSEKTNGVTNGHATKGNGHVYSDVSPTQKELRQLNRSVLRFAEQGWSVVYYSIQWSYGLYIHRQLPTRIFDPKDLWLNYPHITLAGPLKFYYLTQTAFYLHQILILNAEARRKDHVQMMTHHVITIVLMTTSYFTNFTRIGCVIMVLMDWCDIFLPLAKMIRYIDISQLACDMTFGIFLVSWFITRHLLFLFVIRSTLFDARQYIPSEVSPEKGIYFDDDFYFAFSGMLLALQFIQIIWFWMICRVAWRVINGSGASDDRSDDEGDKDD